MTRIPLLIPSFEAFRFHVCVCVCVRHWCESPAPFWARSEWVCPMLCLFPLTILVLRYAVVSHLLCSSFLLVKRIKRKTSTAPGRGEELLAVGFVSGGTSRGFLKSLRCRFSCVALPFPLLSFAFPFLFFSGQRWTPVRRTLKGERRTTSVRVRFPCPTSPLLRGR